jgi:hypothetical protein
LHALPQFGHEGLSPAKFATLFFPAQARTVLCLKDVTEQDDSIVGIFELLEIRMEVVRRVPKAVPALTRANVKVRECSDFHGRLAKVM